MEVRYDISSLKSSRLKRLAKEHELLDELCRRSNSISYRVLKQIGNLPPEGYIIEYNVRSIVAIDSNSMPIYGDKHEAEIIFPSGYPGADAHPKCYMVTDVWHPNVKSKGDYKGKICVNAKSLGAWHTFDQLVLFIGNILQYKSYHAQELPPYPEDATVAKWVREFAEPAGIVGKNKPIDNSDLLLPEEGYEVPEVVRPAAKIKIRVKKDGLPAVPDPPPTRDTSKIRIKIK